jgi:antitoxin (DNA-binding transcriptional repressor) of toxin-antitoxin stability system
MSVIHISRSEAANDFDGILTLAADGHEVFIESNERVVARVLPADAPKPRLLSESLRILKQRGSAVTLDGDFGRDIEEAIASHREPLNPPDWD